METKTFLPDKTPNTIEVISMATATAKTAKTAKTKEIPASETAEDIVTQLQNGGQSAIGAVRNFIGKLDESLAGSSSPSAVHDIVDSALEMSDRMVEHGGDALRGVTRSIRERSAA